ncbi:MAG: hypothetical protein V3W41_13480 [Planctomycetota bacterium]
MKPLLVIIFIVFAFLAIGAFMLAFGLRRESESIAEPASARKYRDQMERVVGPQVSIKNTDGPISRYLIENELESRDGGFDVVTSAESGYRHLADAIVKHRHLLDQRGERVFRIVLGYQSSARGSDDYSAVRRSYAKGIEQELRHRGEHVIPGRIRNQGDLTLTLEADESPLGGPLIVVRAVTGPWARSVIQIEDSKSQVAQRRSYYRPLLRPIHFVTAVTTDPESAVEDSIDTLARRIRTAAYRHALSRNWVDEADEARFRQILDQRYGRDTLINLGETRITPLQETDDNGGTLYRATVSWTGADRDLEKAAQVAAQSMIAEQRAPWIRLGLSFGTIILSLLLWFRIDWWLKGHYSWLTRFAMLILGIAATGLVWNLDLHV